MKKILLTSVFIAGCITLIFAQQKTPTILKGPADWGFERMDFPLGFAPGIKFTGFEEIRFAPGMFDTTSANYFTYAFVVAIEGQKNFLKADITAFLDEYFKGLCISIGQQKKITPDTSQVNADVTEIPGATASSPFSFTATIPYFDTFSNGRKICLYLELGYTIKTEANKTYLTVLISASKDNKDVWNKLHEVKKEIVF
ncbi:MAG: hypothetical protein V1904_01175 [Bacteroidota bacterium]